MFSSPAPHPPEFRQRAVEAARAGHTPIVTPAEESPISESCLGPWTARREDLLTADLSRLRGGRNSMVVDKNVQESQIDSNWVAVPAGEREVVVEVRSTTRPLGTLGCAGTGCSRQ